MLNLLAIEVAAQNKTVLRGTIVDSLTGEALPFANISVETTNLGTSSDANGYFIVSGIPYKPSIKIKVSYMGYSTKEVLVELFPDKISSVTVMLSANQIQLEEIEKVGKRQKQQNETDISIQKIDIRKIESLPKGVETDVLRSLQFIPGVQGIGDVSAKYYVRGSSSNQNLILYNGITIYNPYHALGLFSIIDPDIINSLEFYKGGFPAEYGGKLSSVLNLVSKDGNKNRFSGSTSIGFLSGKGTFEGPLPFGSFIIAGRKSLFSSVLKNFLNFKNAPFNFYDLALKLNYASTQTKTLTKISLHGFNSSDKLISESTKNADYKWSNNIYGINLFQEWEDIPLYTQSTLSYSNFSGEIVGKESNTKPRKNLVTDITLKSDFTYINLNRDELHIGYNLTSIYTDLYFKNLQSSVTDIKNKSLQFVLYGKYKFLQFADFGADVGLRVNAITLTEQRGSIVEPRISLTYNPIPFVAIKAAWGIYTQEMITLSSEDEVISVFEPWVIVPDYLKPSEAIHYILGAELISFSGFNFSTEVYYKSLINTLEPNKNKVDSSDPDFVSGTGESYGSEFQLNYNSKFLESTLSYSLLWSYRKLDNWISYPKYDSRHNLNFNTTLNFGDGWSSSISWFFNSGLPFTQIVGYYDKLYVNDLFNTYGLFGSYIPFTVLGDKNLGRLPAYHRLDFNLTKKIDFKFMKMILSFDVLNLYDRKNIFYFDRKTGERVNMLPVLPTLTLKIEL